MRFLICTIMLSLPAAMPAFAQQPDAKAVIAPTGPAASAAIPATTRKTCRTFPVTGRRVGQSLCYTPEQWAEYDRAKNDPATQSENDASTNTLKKGLNPGVAGQMNMSSMFGLGPQQ